MTQLCFLLTLLEDVVVTERSQSAGAAASLDYIPGANFLGIAARHYGDFGEEAFNVFHGGSVRFGNAYPVTDSGEPTIPLPLSWHYLKGTKYSQADGDPMLHGSRIFNLADEQAEASFQEWQKTGEQARQLRSGYFSSSGAWRMPQTSFCLKTAINRTKCGWPVKSQLFGYEALSAGSRWYFAVECDSTVSHKTVERLQTIFSGTVAIGKSRSAEYGRARCVAASAIKPITESPAESRLFHIYLLSDIALRDHETGLPTLTADVRNFGLAGDDLDFVNNALEVKPEMSFLRSRIYAPFNRKRRSFDLERQVLVKGGVVTMQTRRSLNNRDVEKLHSIFDSGLGCYRQDGLGKVLLNPAFLSEGSPRFLGSATPEFGLAVESHAGVDGGELGKWLSERCIRHKTLSVASEEANRLLPSLAKACIEPGDPKPSASQWRQVAAIAMKARGLAEMESDFFGERGLCNHGVAKKQWATPIRHSKGKNSLAVLESVVRPRDEQQFEYIQQFLYHLGVEMPKAIRKEKSNA